MGGPGSGSRYRWESKKQCAEECPGLDTAFLRRRGWLQPGVAVTGPVRWKGTQSGRTEVTVTTDLTPGSAAIARLSYTVAGMPLTYAVRLVPTNPHYGGVRWWFLCPLTRRGFPCGRRVRKLYLAGMYFGCRECQNLTYKSRQEHDARVSRLIKNPALVASLLGGDIGQSPFLAIKAGLNLTTRQTARLRPVGRPNHPAPEPPDELPNDGE